MARNVIPCPKCNEKSCFANEKGSCICLIDNDFGDRECPFYKPKEEIRKQQIIDKRKKVSA